MNISNIGEPQVANRAFVAFALDAGVEGLIAQEFPLAVDTRTLLIRLKERLEESNPTLAEALNTQTLDAVLDYISSRSDVPSSFVRADKLPKMLDLDGPAEITAQRDPSDRHKILVTFSNPPEGCGWELYVDYRLKLNGSRNEHSEPISIVVYSPKSEKMTTVRVLYANRQGIGRFGTAVIV